MYYRTILLFLVLVLILSGCRGSNLRPEEVLKTMEGVDQYTTEAIMQVKNNKSVFIYNMRQYYKKRDKLRIEFLDKDGRIDQTIVYNDKQCALFHKNVKKPFIRDNFDDSKEYISFLGEFLRNYRFDEEAYIRLEKEGEEELYVLRCNIERENPYFKYAELYADVKRAIPQKLIIYGDDDSKNIEVIYENFKINQDIDDTIFDIDYKNIN